MTGNFPNQPQQTGARNRDDILWSLAIEQISPWLIRRATMPDLETELHRLNGTEPNVFLIALGNGKAELVEKPQSARHALYEMSLNRARGYWMWLNAVVHERFSTACGLVGVFVGDGSLPYPAVPVFAFQKAKGNRSLLLPDPDLLNFVNVDDKLPYAGKDIRASFVGSTTGGPNTREMLYQMGGTPRVKSALFFRNRSDVDFRLPNIVQCDSNATIELLRTLGFGAGGRVSWDEQLGNRFILSMDGNGATCSRVIAALSSNSALVKYSSPHVLYYFPGLQAWRHFIPVDDDMDVLAVLDIERADPGFFEPIARAGRDFAEAFLCRDAVLTYTEQLLRQYIEHFVDRRIGAMEPPTPGFWVLTHVSNIGDVSGLAEEWAGRAGSGQAIEGFMLWPRWGIAAQNLSYQAATANGVLSPPVAAGQFCGTRGAATPVYGYCIRLGNDAAPAWRCSCWARFADGTEVGPIPDGAPCLTPAGAPLEAIRITVTAR